VKFTNGQIKCTNLVVGGNLASHLFSYLHGVKLISTSSECYLPFEKIDGETKEKIFNSLSFVLSMRGLKPFSNLITDIVWEEKNKLRVIINNRSSQEIIFKRLYVFEPEQIRRLPFKSERKIKLIDQFKKVFCEQHRHKYICNDEEDFLKELHFIGKTKIYGITEIEERDLKNEEYSEYLSKFKLRHLLEHHGLRSGIAQRRLRFDHVKRIKRIKHLSACTKYDNIEFVIGKEKEWWNQIEYSIRLELSQLKKENRYSDTFGMML
jgi:hypothetical protein|tara:strand:+ start:2623 stop:3417 length:795 start_codon:yes stop_codon:yes gene_type:complete